MRQPFEDDTFDAAYAIEATCHAPDRVGCYAEILRVTKPGGLFACYEWCTTDRFDGSAEHRRIVDNIQVGNGLPGVQSTREVLQAARDAGWEVLEFRDLAEALPHYPVPWYEPLAGGFSLRNFRTSLVGVFLTTVFCYVLETLFILPRGTYNTQQFLIKARLCLLLFSLLTSWCRALRGSWRAASRAPLRPCSSSWPASRRPARPPPPPHPAPAARAPAQLVQENRKKRGRMLVAISLMVVAVAALVWYFSRPAGKKQPVTGWVSFSSVRVFSRCARQPRTCRPMCGKSPATSGRPCSASACRRR